MERTQKKERKENAKLFYQHFCDNGQKAAIVVRKPDNGSRTQFITAHPLGTAFKNIVIAESREFGIEGCFYEFIESIFGGIRQTGYYEDGFKGWIEKTCHMKITWNDGLVVMIEYSA